MAYNSPALGNPIVESTSITLEPTATSVITLVLGVITNSPYTLPFRGTYCVGYKSKKICCKNQIVEQN